MFSDSELENDDHQVSSRRNPCLLVSEIHGGWNAITAGSLLHFSCMQNSSVNHNASQVTSFENGEATKQNVSCFAYHPQIKM